MNNDFDLEEYEELEKLANSDLISLEENKLLEK